MRMRMNTTVLLSAAVALSFFAVACGDDGTGPGDDDGTDLADGTFVAVVTGAVEDSLEGEAAFVVTTDPSHVSIDLFSDGGTVVLGGDQIHDEHPTTGTFPIGDGSAEPGASYTGYFQSGGQFVGYESESGELRIARAEPERLVGTFEFEAVNTISGDRISVEAEFNAACVDLAATGQCW